MTKLLLTLLALIAYQSGFSQSDKVAGTVMNETIPIAGAEVLNISTKKITVTARDGSFNLDAKAADTLLFIAPKYDYKKIVLSKDDIDNQNLIIRLSVKIIELDEVVVQKSRALNYAVTQGQIDEARLARDEAAVKNPYVYDGAMVNAVNFIRIGKDIAKLYKKVFNKSTSAPPVPEVAFKDYIKSNIEPGFFLNKLKLKPDEIPLFIEYCDADPDSKTLGKQNVLNTIGFLLAKNQEFKALQPK